MVDSAGGADVILIPEIPYRRDALIPLLKQRKADGFGSTMIVVAEGAKERGKKLMTKEAKLRGLGEVRLGGIGSGGALCHARSPSTRRHAERARPNLGHPLRCRRRAAHRSGPIRPHGDVSQRSRRRRVHRQGRADFAHRATGRGNRGLGAFGRDQFRG